MQRTASSTMEASSTQPYKEKEPRVHRPCAFDKMEGLVREMQDPENGVPVRSQKLFLTSIPSAFMGECHRYLHCGISLNGQQGQDTTVGCLHVAGYDLIEWLMERLNIEESAEAVHIANQLCQYGYFFPVNDSRTLTVKDDSSLYRFQTPYYWPWQHRIPDNVEYAIYLAKRTLRNKQRHGLEEYEIEALNSLKRNLQNKWDIIQLQAEEQVRLSKERKKGDKIVCDSQERAFWRVYRPPPGCTSNLEVVPVPTRARPGLSRALPRKRTLNDLQREVDLLRNSVTRTRIKISVAIENLKTHFETYMEYDPMMTQPQPSNPWITDDQTFWQLNSSLVEVPTEKRVKRWGLSMEELMSDPTGLQEFTNYLRKEYSHENIRFWLAVKDLRHSYQTKINDKVIGIFREFLAPGAPCEINIDSKTMEKVQQEMNYPTRFTFDAAAEHVYTLLLKKDCYPRFIRSDHYRNLLAAGVQPLQKKRFFGFVGQGKKKISSNMMPIGGNLLHQHQRRRSSDRSLSGSAHELAVCGVRETAVPPQVPHSHSQSNLSDIPYRDASMLEIATHPADDVCPWDVVPLATSSGRMPSAESALPAPVRPIVSEVQNKQHQQQVHFLCKNSLQLNSGSSSSDVSIAIAEVSERLRKTSGIAENSSYHHPHHHHHYHHHHQQQQQQHQQQKETQQSSSRGGFVHIQRNYSIGSAETTASSARVKFAETTTPSVSTCNFASPEHSFDLSYVTLVPTQIFYTQQQLQHQPSSIATLRCTQSFITVPKKAELQSKQQQQQSRTTAKAPLINISAIVGDLPKNSESTTGLNEEARTHKPDSSSNCTLMNKLLTRVQSLPEVTENIIPKELTMLVPEKAYDVTHLSRESDTKQDVNKIPMKAGVVETPDTAASEEQRDNNVNEVCPWEDEENCKVDAPYVKTYATLGYL